MRYGWLFCLTCCVAFGQEFRGSLSGRILDSSGAVLPGASVSAINQDTNAAKATVTNEQGRYHIPFLLPGNYRLLVEHPGFKKIETLGVRVSIGSTVVLDFTLELAALSEKITVTAVAPLLNTSNADLGQVVEKIYIENIPVSLTRNAVNRVFLAPGVTGETGTVTSNAQSNISIAGGGSTQSRNEFMVDGIPNTVARSGGLIVFVPSLDSVEEMKVQTTLFDAAYGHSNGGAVNITTRGGTNELHGAVYDFKRWKALNANSWTNNQLGLPKPPVNFNQYGAVLSGPVRLPHLYNGQNRTFFSFSYETDSDKRQLTREARVPTELERSGDFSQTLNRRGTGPLEVYDPWTTTGSGAGASRTPFPGGRIPAARLSPTGVTVSKAYPLPNVGGTPQIGRFNWAATGIYEVVQRQFSIRGDHVISPRQRAFARFSRLTRKQEADEFFRGILSFPVEGSSDLGLLERFFHSVAIDDTITFTPTFVGSVRYGFSGRSSPQSSARTLPEPSALSLPDVVLQNQATRSYPRIELGENFATIGGSRSQDNFYTHAALATFNRVAGKHSVKFGIDYRLSRWNLLSPGSAQSGSFTFSPVFTQANPFVPTSADTSGSALAGLLLGIPASGSLGFNSPLSLQNHYLAGFVQEDWKVLPNLTINFGLRYDLETPYTERYNRAGYGFDYSAPPPIRVPGLDLRGGLLFAGVGNPRREGNLDTNNFAPRFGFAFSLNEKTVLRGGYGLFYSAQSYNSGFDGSVGTFNAVTPYVGTIDSGGTPFTTLASPFPSGIRRPEGSEKGLAARYGEALTFFDQNRVNPYNQQWQLGLQREFPGQILVEAAYMGMLSLKQLESFNLNEKPDRYNEVGAEENRRIPNPFLGYLDPISNLGQGTTIVQRQLWFLYPQFTTLRVEGANTGRANYHALQLRVEKRFKQGLGFLWTYTNSKLIDNHTTSIINTRRYRGISSLDQPQTMRLAFIHELPFGPGKPLGDSVSGLLARLIEGWSLSGYLNLASGDPLGISHVNGRPVRTRNPVKSGSVSSRLGDQVDPVTRRVLNPYFDIDAFAPLSSIYVVSPEVPFLDELRAPGTKSLNLALFKNVRLWERLKLQVRMEATGVTNTPNFGNPGPNMSQPATFGVIRSAGGARTIQMAARLLF